MSFQSDTSLQKSVLVQGEHQQVKAIGILCTQSVESCKHGSSLNVRE